MPPAPQISVIIVSRNRADELINAIRSVLTQTVDLELIVIDDGSTDDTPRMVPREFPQAKFIRFEQSQGHIIHRNAGIFNAAAPIAMVLDDDATLQAPDTLARTLADFGHPRVVSVAIPFTEYGEFTRLPPVPDTQKIWITNQFFGGLFAIRKDIFTKFGGFREDLRHFGEECDLCTRLLAAGYVVRIGTASPGEHHFALSRDKTYERYYAARNAVFFPWHNVPMPGAAVTMAARSVQETLHGFREKFWTTQRGLWAGFGMSLKTWGQRRPPDRKTYALFNELRRRKMVPLEEVEPRLPPLAQ